MRERILYLSIIFVTARLLPNCCVSFRLFSNDCHSFSWDVISFFSFNTCARVQLINIQLNAITFIVKKCGRWKMHFADFCTLKKELLCNKKKLFLDFPTCVRLLWSFRHFTWNAMRICKPKSVSENLRESKVDCFKQMRISAIQTDRFALVAKQSF